ncbi:MAG TPA: hypothetical protein VJZ76_11470 [Thermoanaerobaculia bacterium]|nr:hypothetical protein [Thermoanaerobaculia bacterium]
MTSLVSSRWIAAETVAWPFRSPLAFERAVTHLNAADRFRSSDTAGMAEELEEWIRPRARGLSLDALRRAREGVWFGENPGGDVPLFDLLAAAAARHLDCRGSTVTLLGRSGTGVRDIAASWRYLSLALPADLLFAVASLVHGLPPPGHAVELATPLIERMLERQPVSETHMHVGAAFPFPLLWTALMIGAIDPQGDAAGGSGVPFGSGAAFQQRLVQAAIVRVLLMSFLLRRGRFDAAMPFREFVASNDVRDRRTLAYIAASTHSPEGHVQALALLRRVLGALADPAMAMPPAGEMVRMYRRLLGPETVRQMQWRNGRPPDRFSVGHALGFDPLSAVVDVGEGLPLPEMTFACRILARLRGDGDLATIFWQYQRIRCMTFRFVTEEPGTAGLDWFTRHYTRLGRVRGVLENALYHCALALQSGGLWLGAMEARTSPGTTWLDVRDEARRCARQAHEYLAEPHPGRGKHAEVGLVLHFIKQGVANGRDVGDPETSRWRYASWYRDVRTRVAAIETMLEFRPETLVILRGVDIANHELAVPAWVVIPSMQRVRDASRIAASRMHARWPRWNCTPLRVTWHGGEDFRRLAEGIRRMHEPIEFGLLSPGDRIGHGIALGSDPRRMLRDFPTVMQPREERLFDLLWELVRYRRGDMEPELSRIEVAREQASALGAAIFGDEVSLDALIAMREELHCVRKLDRIGFAVPQPLDLPPFDGLRADSLVRYYLRDPAVYRRAIVPIEVTMTESEVAMLESAQRFLAGTMGRMEITIESNPSSNQLIGDMSDLGEHPAFRIQPLPGDKPALDSGVPMSINTDNPITFATRLADEYAYVYYALLRAGASADSALEWIDARREDGWRSRFTLRASTDPDVLRCVYDADFARAQRERAASA